MSSESVPPSPYERRRPESLSVLLVEDVAAERWLYSEILRTRGHTVTACSDGVAGWKAFEEDEFALVLLDLTLPGTLDGLEACRRIRAADVGIQPIVLVITGDTDPHALRRVLEVGADDYIAKPIDAKLLNIRLAVAEREFALRCDRAMTQAHLEMATEEMRNLFENLDEVFFSVDLVRDRLLHISPSTERLLGIEPGDFQSGKVDWRRCLLPAAVREQLAAVILDNSCESVVADLDVGGLGGSARFVEGRYKPTVVEGVITRVDAVLADVTERRLTEIALAEQNEEIQLLSRIGELALAPRDYGETIHAILTEVMEATAASVALLARWNDEMEVFDLEYAVGVDLPRDGPARLPGRHSPYRRALDRGAAIGLSGAELPNPEADPVVAAGCRSIALLPLRAGTREYGVLVVGFPRDGGAEGRRLRTLGGVAHLLVLYLERAQGEEDLRERERSARELARQLGRAKDELESFAYSISHDLRAPLRTMQGFAHSLLQSFDDTLPDEAMDYARRIVASGERAEELISDLLEYSRLSVEAIELHPVSLDEVVTEALEQLDADLRAAGAEIEVERPLPELVAHHTILVQATLNLVSNAIKFVPDGRRPVVRIRSEEESDTIRLLVEDNGVGIDPSKLDRIFRVFERLSGDVHREGTGIGLAIVRRTMERIGGEVDVISTPGEGSTFALTLPIR
ncbi:MAG: ATP-binding protein [Longimicrobiales bacterium]|nr:ATP-binding protein [Longimicrobiales bacterium]